MESKLLLVTERHRNRVSVVCKLLQVSKQGQNAIKARYIRKYPKTRMILRIFEGDSQTLGPRKLEKVLEKVMEIHGI